MSTNTLWDLFVDQLKDVHDAELRLTKALPRLAKAAHSKELRVAFTDHLKETEEHVHRLERVLDTIDVPPARKTCRAIVGILEEGEELMKESQNGVRDAALIAAAQKMEHYEMATYGCLHAWAELLGENEVSRLLQSTLEEEGAADRKLSAIAHTLNMDAMNGRDDTREQKRA